MSKILPFRRTFAMFSFLTIISFIVNVAPIGIMGLNLWARTDVKQKTISVAIFNIPPNGWEEHGEYKGFYVEVIQKIFAEAQLKAKFVLTTRPRAVEMLQNGEIDSSILATLPTEIKNAKRLPVFHRDTVIVTNKSHPIKDADSVHGVVGRIGGVCLLLEKNPHVTFRLLTDYIQGLHLVKKNRILGVCGSREAAVFAAKKAGYNLNDFYVTTLGPREISIYFSNTLSATEVDKIQKAVEKLQVEQGFNPIFEKYDH